MLSSTTIVRAEDGIYTVKRGDNLSKIAKEVYGDSNEWRTIYEANKDTIKDANILYVGQQLILPQTSHIEEISTIAEDISVLTELPTTSETSAATEIPTINGISVSETVAVEGNSYKLNTCYWDWQNDMWTMGPMDVSIGKSDLNEIYSTIFDDLVSSNSVSGYEWKNISITYRPLFGLDDFFEMDWRWKGSANNTDNWTAIDTNYAQADVYNFTMHYNGMDYTDCKYISFIDGDEYVSMTQWVYVLVPQNIDNTVQFTIYASDGEKAIESDYINIAF